MAGVDRKAAENRAETASVKDTVNIYGERILDKNPRRKNSNMKESEKLPSRGRELHLAKRDLIQLDSRMKFAETAGATAEMELSNARKTVKDLTLQIEGTNATTEVRKRDLHELKKSKTYHGERPMTVGTVNIHAQYIEVMRELNAVKHELCKLKLDMASVQEAKAQAEKQSEESNIRVRSEASSIETLKKDIEEVNEEEVLVELARIEAVKEFRAIEAQRENDATQFSIKMENTRIKIENLIEGINHSKELEMKLAITNSDVDVLQSELKLVKAMDQNSRRMYDETGSSKRMEDKQETALLKSMMDELDEAKKELNRIKEEGFQFMASMDIIRNELKQVSGEMTRLKNLEVKTDSDVKNLNSKLLRAKSKLEKATEAEAAARSIVSNLTATFQQLKIETESAKEEHKLITEKTASIKLDIQKTESDIELEEEKLQAAMEELEAVKASEALALERLRSLTEKTMKNRAANSLYSFSITISEFEYQYLTRRAEDAEEIADKKVTAAQAWIEALKAGEKEIQMKTEMVQRETRELRMMEEQEQHKAENALTATRAVDSKLHKWRQHEEQTDELNLQIEVAKPRKSMIENSGVMTPRHNKIRRPASPGIRYAGHSNAISLTRKKNKKVMPGLVKFFKSKKTEGRS